MSIDIQHLLASAAICLKFHVVDAITHAIVRCPWGQLPSGGKEI